MNRILNSLAAVLITAVLTPLAMTTGCGDETTIIQSPGQAPPPSPSPSPSASPSPAPTQVTVNITQVFALTHILVQQNITHNIATLVIFNDSDRSHSIISDNGRFNTGVIKPGHRVTILIDEPGEFTFHCGIHPGETGTVQVAAAAVVTPTPTPTETPTPTATPSPTATPTPTETPTPSPTPSPSVTPSPLQSPDNTIVISAGAIQRTTTAFAPGPITVDQGTTVTVVNNDSVPHTATADNRSFDTGIIPAGGTATFVADQAGDIAFHCTIHPLMAGVLRVRGTATPTPSPSSPPPTPSPTATVGASDELPGATPTPRRPNDDDDDGYGGSGNSSGSGSGRGGGDDSPSPSP